MAAAGLAGAAQATTSGGVGDYYGQRLAWSGCGSGYQCANLSVPLDYSKPRGKRIKISMVRLPATGKKTGSIVLNFGGPGGSGVDAMLASKTWMSAAIRRHFDVVSFDPRGVGRSAPVTCLSPNNLDAYFARDTSPDNKLEVKLYKLWDRDFAKGCARLSGKQLLAHVSTSEAARDMDVMRATLGDQRLTYFGFSYGTYLGARYADLFPTRVRAMVLDGAEDPNQSQAAFASDQARGFQVARASFLRDCFKAKDCPFKKHTVSAALKRLEALYRRADKAPLRNFSDGRQINEPMVRDAVDQAMYDTGSWPRLRAALTFAFKGEGTFLLQLADQTHGRRLDGSYDNSYASRLAITCLDHPEAKCPNWPVKGKRYPRKVHAKGSPAIVVVGTTRDPATPYQLARRLAAQLDKGVLLTHDGDGHTAYKGSKSCLDRQIDRYLITATAPSPGACAKV